APPQLTNDEPAAAAAFKATEVPASNWFEQVAPQLMPAGVEVTVPLPVPCLVTVMIVGGAGPLFTSAGVGPLSLQPVGPRTQMVQSTTAQRMFPIKFPRLIEIVSCYVQQAPSRSGQPLQEIPAWQ